MGKVGYANPYGLDDRKDGGVCDDVNTTDFQVTPYLPSIGARQHMFQLRREALEVGGWYEALRDRYQIRDNPGTRIVRVAMSVIWGVAYGTRGVPVTIRWRGDKVQYKYTPEGGVKIAVNGFRCPWDVHALRKLLLNEEERRLCVETAFR